jgi:hypothetical protein
MKAVRHILLIENKVWSFINLYTGARGLIAPKKNFEEEDHC